MEMVFRGPPRLLGTVVALGWSCTRSTLVGGAEGVVIACRLLYPANASLLPPIIIQAVQRDRTAPATVALEARIVSSSPDVVQSNNADRAEAAVGIPAR